MNSINPVRFNQPTINFKSAYPVVHWVSETNGSYAPALSLELVKKLQGSLVRVLNKTDKPLNPVQSKVKEYIKTNDRDYGKFSVVRSFYDRKGANGTNFKPIAYMISGKDVDRFNKDLGEEIGRSKGFSIQRIGNPYSAEAKIAIENYMRGGLKFVNNLANRLKGKDSEAYVLHTKFEIERNRAGKIKGYRLVDARFLPEKGKDSPIERYKQG